MQHKLFVKGIDCYAYHGCMEEEGIIGGRYNVDVEIESDMEKACTSDNLDYTVDYCVVTDVVKKCMGVRSKLIEAVAYRIIKELNKAYPEADFWVEITKIKPPINHNVKEVCYRLGSK